VVNVPNLGSTPRVQQLAILLQDPTIPFLAGLVSSQFNLGLVGVLQGLALHPNYNQIQFQVLDAFALLDAVIAQPDQHGFEVVNESCIISDAQGKSHCNKPATYLFWDGQHPTTAAHGIFAEAAYDLLTQ